MEHSIVVAALGALAHENRLAVVRLLLEHAPAGLPAGAIGERLDLAPATLSFHLKELARTGLVAAQPEGRFIWYRANVATMNGLVAYLTDNCCLAQSAAACCGPITPKPRIVARTRLENLA
jgi:DNA-binding transcriptional ArsR family regulator